MQTKKTFQGIEPARRHTEIGRHDRNMHCPLDSVQQWNLSKRGAMIGKIPIQYKYKYVITKFNINCFKTSLYFYGELTNREIRLANDYALTANSCITFRPKPAIH